MTNLLNEARSVLDGASYRTLLPNPDSRFIYFENAHVLGIVHALDSVQDMFREWESLQNQFLRENAPRLIADPFKAWNCYCVLLTATSCAPSDASALCAIEEDFRGTRKIVRAGVTTRTNAENALAPLLPLRRVLSFDAEDMKVRLSDRLGPPQSPLQGLLTDVTVHQIAISLIGPE